MALSITEAQYKTAKTWADAGNYVEGWKYLASLKDNYADNAYVVASGYGRADAALDGYADNRPSSLAFGLGGANAEAQIRDSQGFAGGRNDRAWKGDVMKYWGNGDVGGRSMLLPLAGACL